jgi:membrane associated rhomboid family serine protease
VLPLGDDNTGRVRTPVVTYALILVNVLVFVFLQGLGTNERFTYAFATVPQEIRTGEDVARPVRVEVGDQAATINLQPTPGSVYLTLLVSMFMHGSLMHLLGNMLFLWIFGDNIEHRIGHLRFIAFYLICGIAAGLAHIFFNSESMIPTVGASGAISGVLGGYLISFPRNRVYVMTWGGVASVPAVFMLGLWILLQFVNGFGSVADTPETGGVAYLAHIGGFVAGMILAPLFTPRATAAFRRRN